jgi:hypothetical protein
LFWVDGKHQVNPADPGKTKKMFIKYPFVDPKQARLSVATLSAAGVA